MPAARALTGVETRVQPDWVDYNGHMNDAAYATVISRGIDALMDWLGIDAAFRAEHRYTLYTLELHIRYLREAHEGQALVVAVRLIDHDAKRLHVLMTLRDGGDDTEVATGEVMLMGMDQGAGRPAPFPAPIAERVDRLWRDHGCRERPDAAGAAIGIPRRR